MGKGIGFVVASHGKFCEGALDSLRMVAGEVSKIECVSVEPTTSNEEAEKAMSEAVNGLLESSDEVIIFCDLPCGTPANVAVRLMLEDERLTVVTGFSLAVLLEAVTRRDGLEGGSAELLEGMDEVLSASMRVFHRENG